MKPLLATGGRGRKLVTLDAGGLARMADGTNQGVHGREGEGGVGNDKVFNELVSRAAVEDLVPTASVEPDVDKEGEL